MSLTVESFIAMTRRIVARDGFDDYLPTLVLPATQTVLVLEGVPDDVDVEQAACDWAAKKTAPSDDFLVAFKVDRCSVKVVARLAGAIEEQIAIVTTI